MPGKTMEPARHLAAHAQGQFICEAWTGTVLTVHARAVNILRADGLVVSLVADMDSMTGLGVCVPGLFEEPPEAAAVGREVVRDGQWIEVAEFARLDLSKSRMWKSTIDDALIREVPAARIAQVRDALLLYGKTGGLLGILSPERATNPFVEKARKALVDRRLEALVGLGPGLTPAGDDFLVGALMAFPCKPRGELLRAAWPWTTPAGRTLLWMALRRSFPAYLVALADCIVCSNSPEAISEAVRVACAHGETSGSDALAGFCWARLNLNRTRLRPDAVRCRLKAWQ